MNTLVLYRHRPGYEYDLDWRDAFLASPDLDCEALPLAPSPSVVAGVLRAECVVLLPSVDPGYAGRSHRLLAGLLRRRRGRLVYLPRNEFKDFRGKRSFIRRAGVDLTASRLPLPSARYLYGDLAPTIELPHATNPRLFHPPERTEGRPLDLGSRTAVYPPIVLDSDRNDVESLVRAIRRTKPRWTIDYSSRESDRFSRAGWARFLRSARLTASSEAGAAFVARDDRVQRLVERRLAEQPDLKAEALRQEARPLTAGLPSGKHVTSRHFEAAGCATAQLLIEGSYNGLLRPGEHYLEIRSDLSNLGEVLERADDPVELSELTGRTLDLVLSAHTYDHRVAALAGALGRPGPW